MTDGANSGIAPAAEPRLELIPSRQFTAWLAEHRVSLAFTTYQTGKLFLVGLDALGRLSVFERTFNRSMGLCASGNSLWMSTLYQLWRLENVCEPGEHHNGHDRLYVPMLGYTTGDVDIHDVALDGDSSVWFVNTLFSCLASPSEQYSFIPRWRPPFISKLAAEDRCHLNGLAMSSGRPAYVTAVAETDAAEGWRDQRHGGGIVIEVATGRTIAGDLSMPHSPRVYRDQLWLLDSGRGYLGRINPASGEFTRLTFCPGYLRGLAFVGDFAVVGMSKPRESQTLAGLELDDELAKRNTQARCALAVIDLRTGDLVHELRIEGIVMELYDVVVLGGVLRPMALGFKTDEIRRTIRVGTSALPDQKG